MSPKTNTVSVKETRVSSSHNLDLEQRAHTLCAHKVCHFALATFCGSRATQTAHSEDVEEWAHSRRQRLVDANVVIHGKADEEEAEEVGEDGVREGVDVGERG